MMVDAREVYILMKNDYRISRNTRASWYFNHLNSYITTKRLTSLDDVEDELEVVSILPKTIQATTDSENINKFKLTPQTNVIFIARRYRLVFILDISPSLANVDIALHDTLCSGEFSRLQQTLKGLVQQFFIPGTELLCKPEIYVSIIAHTSLISCSSNQVLVQGVLVTEENLDDTLRIVRLRLNEYENMVAVCLSQIVDTRNYEDFEMDDIDNGGLTGGLFEDIIEKPRGPNITQHVVTPDANFVNMLRYGILGLQLLPQNSAAGIIIVTDGIVGLPDASIFESLMIQLRHATIECSFIKVGNTSQNHSGFGHVPYCDLMQFISIATFGAYFSQLPCIDDRTKHGSGPMNGYHHAFLTWSFQKSSTGAKIDDYKEPLVEEMSQNLVWTHRVPGFGKSDLPQWLTPLMKKKHTERNAHTPIANLISCRLREGYTIREVTFSKGETQIEVKMMLPWRENVRIMYTLVSGWPWPVTSSTKRHSHVEVSVEASYEFLYDVLRTVKTLPFRSAYRRDLIKKYRETLQSMSDTDQLLVHLHSFSSQAVYYNVPESLRHGVPLFDFFPNSKAPEINQQLSTKDADLNQFAAFWQLVVMLDVNTWQKWMHIHRLGILLEHDKPLGRHLHIPNSSGRFQTVTCNQAFTALNFFLRDWSTFVLMENHSYVKLLHREKDKPPTSFYVIRVASKPPCLVLRIAFLVGTPGELRNKILSELHEAIQELHLPHRGGAKDEIEKVRQRRLSKHDTMGAKDRKPPLQRLCSETPCCIFVEKPVEKILMKYDRMPHNFSTVELPLAIDQSGQFTQISSANKAACSNYLMLSKYLWHQRWVWSVQHAATSMSLSMQAVGRVLSALTNIRLQEGFSFAHSNAGIISMAVELNMKNIDLTRKRGVCTDEARKSDEAAASSESDEQLFPCVMQYLVFPPHTTTTKDAFSDEDYVEDLEETTESDGELQIITECWIEPQHGNITLSTPERSHFEDLTYKQVPHAIYPIDHECISTMLTFEHLNLMCQSNTVPPPYDMGPSRCSSASFPKFGTRADSPEPSANNNIQHIAFPFNLMSLLPKCQQVEILLSTFVQDSSTEESTRGRAFSNASNIDSSSPNNLLFSMFHAQLRSFHDRSISLTHEECIGLMSTISERDRQERPVPFSPWQAEDENERVSVNRSESAVSIATNVSATTNLSFVTTNSLLSAKTYPNFQQIDSSKPPQVPGTVQLSHTTSLSKSTSVLNMQRNFSPFTPTGDSNTDGGHNRPDVTQSNSKDVPKWCCYMKSVSSTHMFLCLVPATYKDLQLLVAAGDETAKEPSGVHQQTSAEGAKTNAEVSKTDESTLGNKFVDITECEIEQAPTNEDTDPSSDGPLPPADDKQEADLEATFNSLNLPLDNDETIQAEPENEENVKMDADEKTSCGLILPIYIYNCQLQVITEQLVNKWTYEKDDDIFIDLSNSSDSYRPEADVFSSPRPHRVSDRSNHSGRSRGPSGGDKEDRYSGVPPGVRSGDEQARCDPIYGEQTELKNHSSTVAEIFFRCFVNGIFRSLQCGYKISTHDVESAIDSMLEEIIPFEIKITQFLQCVCGHSRQLIEKVNLERMMEEDMLKAFPSQTHSVGESKTRSESDTSSGATPVRVMRFPLAILQGDRPCESHPGLHALIRNKFSSIMEGMFRPVPMNPDYYYFYPQYLHERDQRRKEEQENQQKREQEQHQKQTFQKQTSEEPVPTGRAQGDDCEIGRTDEESDVFTFNKDDQITTDQTDRESIQSIHDSLSSQLHELEEMIGNEDDADADDDEDDASVHPLFVYLLCSVRCGGDLSSVSVHHIPTCFSQLKECFGNQNLDIDLNDVSITLDMICLSLPKEDDLRKTANRPCYDRMVSHVSHASRCSSTDSVLIPDDSHGANSGNGAPGPTKNLNLSDSQNEALQQTRKQIEWLLTDEIVSAMRLIVPVAHETLEMVVEHIKNSEEQSMCFSEKVPLKFVYGSDQSLQQFIEDFELMSIPSYTLNKEGCYYYFYLDKRHADSLAHAKALNSALQGLGNDSPDVKGTPESDMKSPPIARIRWESGKTSDENTSNRNSLNLSLKCPALGLTPTKSDDSADRKPKKDQEVTPRKGQSEESEKSKDEVTSPRTTYKIRKFTVSPVEEKEILDLPTRKPACTDLVESGKIDASNKDAACNVDQHDESIEILPDIDPTTKLPNLPVHEEGAIFKPEEIKISITRPSPIKEVKKLLSEEDHGDRERNSSGSSIQVLEEENENEDENVDETLMKDNGRKSNEDESQKQQTNSELHIETASHPQSLGEVQSSQLSPLTGVDELKKAEHMKRAHSSASFEKYKGDKSGHPANSQMPWSGVTTPRRASGQQSPAYVGPVESAAPRLRHHSGTPMSGSMLTGISSRGSWGEAGYDGDSSESEDDGALTSLSDSMIQRPHLPNFWIIMKINVDDVDVYFHTRDQQQEDNEEYVQQRTLYNQVIKIISNVCKQVNQRMLLADLYKTRTCDLLLVPEEDDALDWKKEYPGYARQRRLCSESSDDSEGERKQHKHLEASLKFIPGYFECEMVWQTQFWVHPRLKHGPGRSGASRGIQALRSILNKFAVNNRRNMFVIKDSISEKIFYLRLFENDNELNKRASISDADKAKMDEEVNLNFSRSSSLLSLSMKRSAAPDTDEDMPSPRILSTAPSTADKDLDAASVWSAAALSSKAPAPRGRQRAEEERLTLTVHGIGKVGAVISKDLVDMLQKKLDDAVLDVVTLMLARNPLCKLSSSDVKFIQQPWSAPTRTLRLLIPSAAMLQQYALGFYLKQNLNQYAHAPKYVDPRQENVFRDFTQEHAPPLSESSSFVYNHYQPPPQSTGGSAGGKGIACMHVTFVDGRGAPVQLLGCPKPAAAAYKDSMDPAMFNSMVDVQLYHDSSKAQSPKPTKDDSPKDDASSKVKQKTSSPKMRAPGPTALVQVSLWERGAADADTFNRQMVQAMRWAVCDIVMEYRLLTAPVCEVPAHYTHGMDSPMHSAPPSPIGTHGANESRSVPSHGVKKQISMVAEPVSNISGKTPTGTKEKSAFSFVSDVFKSKSKDKVEEGSSTWQELEAQRRKDADLRSKIHKYETGERGTLSHVYYSIVKDWMDFSAKLGAPAVHKQTFRMVSRFPVDYVLREAQVLITQLSPDTKATIFRQSSDDEDDPVYEPYMAPRVPMATHEVKTESSLDLAQCTSCPRSPGKSSQYIIIGRNVKQWRRSIDYAGPCDPGEGGSETYTNSKTHKSCQRFKPLTKLAESGSPTDLSPPAGSQHGPPYVPRQRFLLAIVNDKQMTLYTYNWTSELNSSLCSQLGKVVTWHNARTNMLACILSHKLGLFQHTQFLDQPLDPVTQEANQFTSTYSDLDLLVKYTSPPYQQLAQRSRGSGSHMPRPASAPAAAGPSFEDMYRDTKPCVPMHRVKYGNLRDPVHRHGAQMLELRSLERKEYEKKMELMKLYEMWQQRMGSAHVPISETSMELLKNSSRLVHSVASPLLFSPSWRKKLFDRLTPPAASTESASVEVKSARSRHSSGASIKSRRSETVDAKRKGGGVDSPDVNPKSKKLEEAWHVDLRTAFVNQYTQYLHNKCGFIRIPVRPAQALRRDSSSKPRQYNEKVGAPQKEGSCIEYTYLQKTLPGGIMLIEVGFKEVYFSVHVYAFECTRLPVGKSVNPQLVMIFTDECDKFKDLTHVHSFAYDFHLRTIQSYLTGKPLAVFKQNYHLTAFLKDFMAHFPYTPNFSRNYIHEGTMAIINTNSSGHQLFDYMLRHDKLYNMRAVKMLPHCDDDFSDPELEYALISQYPQIVEEHSPPPNISRAACENYTVGLVIAHNTQSASASRLLPDSEKMSLRLKYWVILTNETDLFPKQKLEKKLGRFGAKTPFSAVGEWMSASLCKTVIICDDEASGDDEAPYGGARGGLSPSEPLADTVNYLGFSHRDNTAVFEMLLRESDKAKHQIRRMVDQAKAQCRRDILWNRMLVVGMEETVGRRKHRSGWSVAEAEEPKDPLAVRLSFAEFQELLDIVTRIKVGDMDPQLAPLQNLRIEWYQALMRVLKVKYESSCRFFSSSDGLIQYLVILNPKYLEVFMMLGIDNVGKTAELSVVFREAVANQQHTLEKPSLPLCEMQVLMEGFINICCYHLWAGML